MRRFVFWLFFHLYLKEEIRRDLSLRKQKKRPGKMHWAGMAAVENGYWIDVDRIFETNKKVFPTIRRAKKIVLGTWWL